MTTDTTNDAKNQARAQLNSVTAMVERLNHANECDGDDCNLSTASIFDGSPQWEGPTALKEYHDEDAAREAIEEDALEVSVRSEWHAPNETEHSNTEYLILLCTGGPAVRIMGKLDRYAEPDSAVIEYQDWGTPWTELQVSRSEEATMIEYAHQFYFGD